MTKKNEDNFLVDAVTLCKAAGARLVGGRGRLVCRSLLEAREADRKREQGENIERAEALNEKQPRSTPNALPAVWDLVLADMQRRDEIGAQKHGTRLQPHNGRDVLVDAYQEALDLVVYLRQAIYERDNS